MDKRMVIIVGIVALLAGCGGNPPTTGGPTPAMISLSEARSMTDKARAAGANVETAELFLRQAEQAHAGGNEAQTQERAEKAKQSVIARRAIEDARPVVALAVKNASTLASDAAKLLDTAEAALKAGDPSRASELAAQARRQAESPSSR